MSTTATREYTLEVTGWQDGTGAGRMEATTLNCPIVRPKGVTASHEAWLAASLLEKALRQHWLERLPAEDRERIVRDNQERSAEAAAFYAHQAAIGGHRSFWD